MRQTRQTSASDSSIFHVLLIILKVFKIFNFFGKWHGFWVVKVLRQSCSLWAASTSGRRFFCFLWFLFLLLFFFLFNYNDVIIIFILLGKKLKPISIWRFWRRVRRQRGPNVLGVICIVPVVVLIKFWKIPKNLISHPFVNMLGLFQSRHFDAALLGSIWLDRSFAWRWRSWRWWLLFLTPTLVLFSQPIAILGIDHRRF